MRTEKETRDKLQHVIGDLEVEVTCGDGVVADKVLCLFQTIATLYWVLGEEVPRHYKFNPGMADR